MSLIQTSIRKRPEKVCTQANKPLRSRQLVRLPKRWAINRPIRSHKEAPSSRSHTVNFRRSLSLSHNDSPKRNYYSRLHVQQQQRTQSGAQGFLEFIQKYDKYRPHKQWKKRLCEPPDQSMKESSIRGSFNTLTSQILKVGIQTASTIFLARLIAPKDFGLIAMAASITGILPVIVASGIALTVLRSNNLNQSQLSGLFWTQCGMSGIVGSICVCLAPSFHGTSMNPS